MPQDKTDPPKNFENKVAHFLIDDDVRRMGLDNMDMIHIWKLGKDAYQKEKRDVGKMG